MSRSTSEPTVSVRRMPAATTRASEHPRWEITYGDEATGWRIIGWIEEQHLRGAKNPFYFATAVHPTNGKVYRLEGNIDFDDRVNVIADFNQDPMTSRQHLGLDMIR